MTLAHVDIFLEEKNLTHTLPAKNVDYDLFPRILSSTWMGFLKNLIWKYVCFHKRVWDILMRITKQNFPFYFLLLSLSLFSWLSKLNCATRMRELMSLCRVKVNIQANGKQYSDISIFWCTRVSILCRHRENYGGLYYKHFNTNVKFLVLNA